MRNFILSELTKAVDAFPRPKDGKNGESIVGPPGPAGKDAEVDELKTYFQSEIAKTLLLLPIPKDGIDGKDGKDGQSIKGDPGKDGESVHPDTIRLMVLEEVRKAVDAVVKPKDGDPGRDALDIEVLPAIPEKVVPRGTFAQHRGGVWRAKSTTDNSADWECLWDGFDRFVVHQSEDLRTFQFVATKSSGARLEQTFKLPVLIYRGIFEEGHTYEKGDVVTYGGSSWHCHVDSTSARPASNNADWLMMVREGRKGLDAKPETALGNGTPRVALK